MVKIYKIKLINSLDKSSVVFDCPDNKYILEMAEEANINLPYSCRAGSCSTCLGKIITGSVDQPDQNFLDEEQIGNGYILTCVSYPLADSVISTYEEENLY